MIIMRSYIITFIYFLIVANVAGQVNPVAKKKPVVKENAIPSPHNSSVQDTFKSSFLKIVSADNQVFDATGEDELFISNGNVRITHDSVFMFCDTAILVNGVNLIAKGNVSIIKNDTIKIFSDSLLYQGDSLMAYFVGNVVLEDGDQVLHTSFLQYDLKKDWAIYNDTALLMADNMIIKSKRGIFHLDENYVNFYEKVTIEGENFDLLSDSLRYYTGLKRAIFLSPTLINQGSKRIYSEGGYYDIDDQVSEFFGNAQFVDGDQTSTADTIRNNEADDIIELIGNARFKSKDEVGRANKIIKKKNESKIELLGNAFFENTDNKVTGERIFFNEKTNDVKVSGRSFLSNPPMIIFADDLDYRKDSGFAYADGNVIWKDTSANYEIICDHARYVDSIDYMKAYNDEGKPVLKNEVSKGDTLLLSGDTLISYTVNVGHDSIGIDKHRYFQAFEHVEMINAEMQGVCDSLSYNGQDSMFTLFGAPVMWADSSQYNGDTIKMTMSKSKIKQVDLLGNAMILSTLDFEYFDQIRGKIIKAYFAAGEIDRMKVTGGAESVYYMKDEEDYYTGVNETRCSNMTFIFDDGELLQTRYYKEPTSKLSPMKKANHESIKLKGFNWQVLRRPLSITDLYN
ncbi:MAG: lipopolysaccharide export system protein LptA [Saprospiraceae bacterium]|jgi:lipopolysaccharide export system protein LptA